MGIATTVYVEDRLYDEVFYFKKKKVQVIILLGTCVMIYDLGESYYPIFLHDILT